MKKLLLTLGSIAAVAAPVASVVACGAPAPKHVKLDETKVKNMLPDIKKAIAEIMSDGKDSSVPKSTDTITPDGENFKVNIKLEGAGEIDMVVTPEGDVSDLVIAGKPASDEQLTKIKTIVEGGTIENTGTTEEIKLDATKFDTKVIAGASLTLPTVLADGASNDDIQAHNLLVQTFQNDYEQAVADQAAVVISAIDSTSLTGDSFNKLAAGADKGDGYFIELDEDEMNSLGLDAVTINSLKKFISDGADIQIHKQAGSPTISGVVMCNGNQGTWNGSNVVNFGTTA